MKTLIALALFSIPAVAQIYDVDVTLDNWTFAGTLNYTNGALSSVNVLDAWSEDTSAFTQGAISGNTVTLVDYEGYATPRPSFQWLLSFDVNASQGWGSQSLAVSDVLLNVDGNSTGLYNCNPCGGSLTDPAPTAAPEIDFSRAGAALALLVGGTLVLKGRRD